MTRSFILSEIRLKLRQELVHETTDNKEKEKNERRKGTNSARSVGEILLIGKTKV